VDESTHRIGRHESKQPHDEENDRNCIKHGMHTFVARFPGGWQALTAVEGESPLRCENDSDPFAHVQRSWC
jgi:hypothetical protein